MNTNSTRMWAALALITVGACKKNEPAPTPVTAPTVTDAASATTTSTTPTQTSTAGPTIPSIADAAPAAASPIAAPVGEDLVRRLALTVRASSTTGGSTTADKMLDNDLTTAWNSRTGDLVGAWFETTVPAGVTVQSFAMTAGFTHRSGANDLFAGNHRTERVRVSLNGVAVGEFALDPESRALQTFALSGGAGTYRFTIVAERAGTRASWRELCVSEFVLYGAAPAGMGPTDGAADTDASAEGDGGESNAGEDEQAQPLQPSAPEALEAGPMVADVGAFCTAMQRRNFRRAACNAASADAGRSVCFCGQQPGPSAPETFTTVNRQASLQRPASPLLGAYFMARTPNPTDEVDCDLLVRTPAGLFPFTGVTTCGPGAETGGAYPAVSVRRMRATGGDAGPAELTVEWRETRARPTATRNWACTGNWTARCTVDANNVPSCTKVLNEEETCVAIEGGGAGTDDATE